MKSGTRGLLISIFLFILWGTMVTGPFRFFSYAFRDTFSWIFTSLHVPLSASAILIVVLCTAVSVALLILSNKKNGLYLAGVCALLSLLYYLVGAIRTRSLDTLTFSVTAGLAIALLFLVLQAKKASLILADAYIFSIPVLLFTELALVPLFRTIGSTPSFFAGFIRNPDDALGVRIGDFLGVPMLVWSLFLFAISLIPILFFAKGRTKT